MRDASSSVGIRPFGVSWSTKAGRFWLSPSSRAARLSPVCRVNASSVSAPSAFAQVVGGNVFVGTGAHPGLCYSTLPAVLQVLQYAVEAAGEHVAGTRAE